MLYFKDKVIIITGASSGIGKIAAIRLSELGALNELFPTMMDWFYHKFKLEGEKKY